MKNYFRIPMTVLADKTISSGAKLLYGVLNGLCDQKGYCWATNAYLGKLCCISPRSISRYLSELRMAGLAEIHYAQDESDCLSKRRIRVLEGSQHNATESQQNPESDAETRQKPESDAEVRETPESATEVQDAQPQCNPERRKTESRRKSEAERGFATAMEQVTDWFESLYPQWTQEDRDFFCIIMKEFLIHRKQMGCPLGPGRALAVFCDRLTDLAGDDSNAMTDLLAWAIGNGWKTVFPIKQRKERSQDWLQGV